MALMRWYRKKIAYVIASLFFVYVFLHRKKYNVRFTATIPKSRPVEVWEYVSDFGNIKKLNPTIIDFIIESESGNYDHWKYKVYYTEFLSQISWMTNFAWAEYEVKKLSNDKYAVYSNHKTCFLASFACVHSESTFLIEPTSKDFESTYTEFITYECPAIFSSFCRDEVLLQREKIKSNLLFVFENRHNIET